METLLTRVVLYFQRATDIAFFFDW